MSYSEKYIEQESMPIGVYVTGFEQLEESKQEVFGWVIDVFDDGVFISVDGFESEDLPNLRRKTKLFYTVGLIQVLTYKSRFTH